MQAGKIKELAARYFRDTVDIRRHLHRHPELSFQEKETAKFISKMLKDYGISHEVDIAGHGIVAIIEGQNSDGPCMALRADMDALPIQEKATHDYASCKAGVMHACGHDAHTAMLLTAGRIIFEMRQHFSGIIKLIFQPAEEMLPGGALGMIDAGVLEKPKVSAIIGQHVHPSLEAGMIGFKAGPFMASGDEINIKVKGKGGHAAMPEAIDDTVLIASQIVIGLQQIVSRHAPPSIPTVLSFGRLIANGFHNIIPDEVIIQGTLRTFNEAWRQKAKDHIIQIAQNTAAASGAIAEVQIDHGYPFLVNNDKLTSIAMEAAITYLGSENVVQLEQRMTTEDFGHYSHRIPACFYRLGTGNTRNNITSGLHTPTFDIDETSLETGSGLMAYMALQQLNKIE